MRRECLHVGQSLLARLKSLNSSGGRVKTTSSLCCCSGQSVLQAILRKGRRMLIKQQAASGEQAELGLDHLAVERVLDIVCCLYNQSVTLLEELNGSETAAMAFHSTALLM